MTKLTRHLGWITGAMLVATVGTAVPATGTAVKRFDSKVTLAESNPFHGRVVSDKHACEKDRTVKVFQTEAGTDGLFGTTNTNSKGKWSMPATPNGDFYATVKRHKGGPAGTAYLCRPANSKTHHFGI